MIMPQAKPNLALTQMLDRARNGELMAIEEIWRSVHRDVHAIACDLMSRESKDPILQPTLVVNEVYLRLFGHEAPEFENRRHFFGSVSRAMNQFLVDHARRRGARKRGANARRIHLEELDHGEADDITMVIDAGGHPVAVALAEFEKISPRPAEVARLRVIAGLSVSQAACAIGIAPRTVVKDWLYARAWLHRRLSENTGEASDHDTA